MNDMEQLRIKKLNDSTFDKALSFYCPHCTEMLTYANTVPLNCPLCSKFLPDTKRLMESLSVRIHWHNTGFRV